MTTVQKLPASLLCLTAVMTAAALGVGLAGQVLAQEPAPEERPATRPVSLPETPGAADTSAESGDNAVAPASDADTPATRPATTPATVPAAAAPATVPAEPTASPAPSPEPKGSRDSTTAEAGPQSGSQPDPSTRPSGSGSSRSDSSKSGRSGDGSVSSDRFARPSPGPKDPRAGEGSAGKMDKRFEVLLARSLFSKTRPEPLEAPEPSRESRDDKPAPPPIPEKSMAVRGMSIEGEDGDGECYAFIEDLLLKQMIRVKVGDKVARGMVAEVTLAELVYEYDGKRTRVAIGHTLDGEPAPAVTWTTYTPVATAPPPRTSRTDGRDDSNRDDSNRGDSSRSDSSRGNSSQGNSSQGNPAASPATTPAATPTPVPAASTPTPPGGGAPSTAPAGKGTEDLLERMKRRRELEGQ